MLRGYLAGLWAQILLEPNIHLCFFSQDSALAEVIARALGDGFSTRGIDELQLQRFNDLREWCDVVLLTSAPRARRATMMLAFASWIRSAMSPSPSDRRALRRRKPLSAPQCHGHGAYDSVTNPPNMIELRRILRRAFKPRRRNEVDRLRSDSRTPGRLHELLGTSPAMQELFALAQKIAPCDVSVLITGETGTGKVVPRSRHSSDESAFKPAAGGLLVCQPSGDAD